MAAFKSEIGNNAHYSYRDIYNSLEFVTLYGFRVFIIFEQKLF